MAVATRSAFPPFVTASRWATAWDALRSSAHRRNGSVNGVPRLRNREAVTMAMSWLGAVGPRAFPLWYQYAAQGYGWNPPVRDALVTSLKRSESWYPTGLASGLWSATGALADDLDSSGALAVRLDLADAFADPVTVARVGAALREDGASVGLPTGLCSDDKTGKTVPPELECVSPTGKRTKPRYVNGLPYCPRGHSLEAKCPPGTAPIDIDDPLTGLGKILGSYLIPIVLILAAVGLLGDNPRRSRRLTE